MGDDEAMTESDYDYEDREPIPEDATTEEIEKAAEHDISVQSLRHFIACEAERKADPPRGRAPVIKLDTTKRDMFAADKNRGDRAAWQASGSNRTFEEWKADRDAEALQLAKDNHAAMVAEADAKKLAVEVRKAEAAARKAENELAKAKALAEKAAAEAEKDALPVDYKGLYEALSGLFTVTTDRKLGLLLELQAQHERTFELTLHQFMRLGKEWWNEDFKKMVGHRATAIFKDIFPASANQTAYVQGTHSRRYVDRGHPLLGQHVPSRGPRTGVRPGGREAHQAGAR